jgi:hypothetical protein
MYGEAGVFSSRDLYSLSERRNGEAGVECMKFYFIIYTYFILII